MRAQSRRRSRPSRSRCRRPAARSCRSAWINDDIRRKSTVTPASRIRSHSLRPRRAAGRNPAVTTSAGGRPARSSAKQRRHPRIGGVQLRSAQVVLARTSPCRDAVRKNPCANSARDRVRPAGRSPDTAGTATRAARRRRVPQRDSTVGEVAAGAVAADRDRPPAGCPGSAPCSHRPAVGGVARLPARRARDVRAQGDSPPTARGCRRPAHQPAHVVVGVQIADHPAAAVEEHQQRADLGRRRPVVACRRCRRRARESTAR